MHLLIGILIAAVIGFFLFSLVLSRDDGPYAIAIRLAEILLPFAAALSLSGLFLKTLGHDYFPAASAFGLAVAIALLRRLPSLWFSKPPEGAYVFAYSVAIVAGVVLTGLALR